MATRKRKKITPMKYPVGIEFTYRSSLIWLNNELRKSLRKHLVPIVPKLTEEASTIHHLPTGKVKQGSYKHDDIREDVGWSDDLYDAFRKISEDMIKPKITVTRAMLPLAPRINNYNQNEWKKLIRSQYGVNPTREDPGTYLPLMRDWARDNAALIKDIPEKAIGQIQKLTMDVLFSGQTQDDMVDDIHNLLNDRMDVSDSRARLIARDQVSKLNGRFTQERQTEAGVDSYIWRTVGDERVRETHDAVDGQTYSWSSPPDETDGNHPGEDYQCRCFAEPILPESIDVSAELLEEEEATA